MNTNEQISQEKIEEETSDDNITGDYLQVVCFELAEEEYAFDILNIKEVIHLNAITNIPQMPDFVLGVINIRGTIIPVFDLKKKFSLPSKEFTEDTRIVVTILETGMVGFVVDKVLENIMLEKAVIDPVPAVKMPIDKECVLGIGKLSGRMLTILNIKNVHNTILKDIKNFNSGM